MTPRGSANPSWKGDDASYSSIHQWMNRNHPRTGCCQHCGGTVARTQYATKIPGRWTRDRADWLELCSPCHKKFDGISEETRARISRAGKGKPKSAETRARMSEAQRGLRKPPKSAAHRANLSAALRNSEAIKARSADPEYRAKMSAAGKRRHSKPTSNG